MRLVAFLVSLYFFFNQIFAKNFKRKDLNDLLLAAGNEAEGKTTEIVFLNNFNYIPLSNFPIKRLGPRKETPPNRRFLLPDFSVYLIQTVYILLGVVILLHLLRRRSIDHTGEDTIFDNDRDDEAKLCEMRGSMRSEKSRLYFYQRWTNHVATSLKLLSTFPMDFSGGSKEPSAEKTARKSGETADPKVEKMRLRKQSLENEDDF